MALVWSSGRRRMAGGGCWVGVRRTRAVHTRFPQCIHQCRRSLARGARARGVTGGIESGVGVWCMWAMRPCEEGGHALGARPSAVVAREARHIAQAREARSEKNENTARPRTRRPFFPLGYCHYTQRGVPPRSQRGRPNARNGEIGFFWPENCGAGPGLYMENTMQSSVILSQDHGCCLAQNGRS